MKSKEHHVVRPNDFRGGRGSTKSRNPWAALIVACAAGCGTPELGAPAADGRTSALETATTQFGEVTAHSRLVDGKMESVLVESADERPAAFMDIDLDTGEVTVHVDGPYAAPEPPALAESPTPEEANRLIFDLYEQLEPTEVPYAECGPDEVYQLEVYEVWTDNGCVYTVDICSLWCWYGAWDWQCSPQPDLTECRWWDPRCWYQCFWS